MCLLSRHNHYRRYFSRPPEANSLSTKRRGISPSFRPGYFGPGPLALVSFPAGAFRPGHYAPAPSAPRDRHPRPPAWQGPARRLSLVRRPEARPVQSGHRPRPRSIGGRRGPAFRFVLVSALRGRCPWLSVRASGREPVGTEPTPATTSENGPPRCGNATWRAVSFLSRQMPTWHCHIPCPASPARGSVRRSYTGSVSRGRLAGLRPWRDRARRSRTGVPCL